MAIEFDGQQTDERILARIRAHPFKKNIAIGMVFLLAIALIGVSGGISMVFPAVSGIIFPISIILGLIIITAGFWWNSFAFTNSITYITDRRIIRFEATPFFKTKRALFWNEVLKTKAFAPNLYSRFIGMGTVSVEPQVATSENIIMTSVAYYEDIANFIDKIVYTFKSKPEDMQMIAPFIFKKRGERY